MNFQVGYGITRRLHGAALATVRDSITEALKTEGFGVLTEIDVQATLEKKLSIKTAPYVILGACNPELAHKALTSEPAIGLMLPCNVVVAQDGDDVVVSAASPKAMFAAVGDNRDVLTTIAADAEARLRRAVESLTT